MKLTLKKQFVKYFHLYVIVFGIIIALLIPLILFVSQSNEKEKDVTIVVEPTPTPMPVTEELIAKAEEENADIKEVTRVIPTNQIDAILTDRIDNVNRPIGQIFTDLVGFDGHIETVVEEKKEYIVNLMNGEQIRFTVGRLTDVKHQWWGLDSDGLIISGNADLGTLEDLRMLSKGSAVRVYFKASDYDGEKFLIGMPYAYTVLLLDSGKVNE